MEDQKEPWVYKGTLTGQFDKFSKALKEAQPEIKENFDKMMNEELSEDWKKFIGR